MPHSMRLPSLIALTAALLAPTLAAAQEEVRVKSLCLVVPGRG